MDLFEGNPEALATHARAAGDWQRAFDAWLDAASRAARRYATRDAEELLGHALHAADAGDDPVGAARARLARADVREALADYPAALDDLDTAAELARSVGRPDLEAAALRALARARQLDDERATTLALDGLKNVCRFRMAAWSQLPTGSESGCRQESFQAGRAVEVVCVGAADGVQGVRADEHDFDVLVVRETLFSLAVRLQRYGRILDDRDILVESGVAHGLVARS